VAGVQIEAVRAVIDAAALAERRPSGELIAAVVRIDEAGLATLLRARDLELERIEGGRIGVRGQFGPISGAAQLVPAVGPGGTLRIRVTSVRAGFLPLPGFVVEGALRQLTEGKPGTTLLADNVIEVDLARAAREAGVAVVLPPLRTVGAEGGVLTLELGDA
jgi:hypothetical protein